MRSSLKLGKLCSQQKVISTSHTCLALLLAATRSLTGLRVALPVTTLAQAKSMWKGISAQTALQKLCLNYDVDFMERREEGVGEALERGLEEGLAKLGCLKVLDLAGEVVEVGEGVLEAVEAKGKLEEVGVPGRCMGMIQEWVMGR